MFQVVLSRVRVCSCAQRICTAFGSATAPADLVVRPVRDVAPRKMMLVASFVIPDEIGRPAAAAASSAAAPMDAAVALEDTEADGPADLKRARLE